MAKIQLPNNCSCGKFSVVSKEWQSGKKNTLEKDWYINAKTGRFCKRELLGDETYPNAETIRYKNYYES